MMVPFWFFAVVPAAGVPPANVLAKLDDDLSLEARQTMTLEEYQALKTALAQDVATRASRVTSKRKKRSAVEDETYEEAATLTELKSLKRKKRDLLEEGSYESMILPKEVIYGIFTAGGSLNAPEVCECPVQAPPVRARKEISLHVAWDEQLTNLTSPQFLAFKLMTEEKLDMIYDGTESSLSTVTEYILLDGYAGTNVVAIKLVQEDAIDADPVLDANGNVLPKADDLVTIITESTFPNVQNAPAPKKDLDAVIDSVTNTLGWTTQPAVDGDCKGNAVSVISPPSFLQASVTSADYVRNGLKISFTCKNAGEMMPAFFDTDSNFAMEVECEDGNFVKPPWPLECDAEVVCENVPAAPTEGVDIPLERLDDRQKFRVGEKAYFGCSNAEAVLNDNSGMSVFELECKAGGVWADDWGTCYLEPTCTGLPTPPDTSDMVKATKGDSVKLGERAVYECKGRSEFFETDTGPEIYALCDGPVNQATQKGVIGSIGSWPSCTQLDCVCLGDGLDYNQSVAALQTACSSDNTYDIFDDHTQPGKSFIVPKRFNCG